MKYNDCAHIAVNSSIAMLAELYDHAAALPKLDSVTINQTLCRSGRRTVVVQYEFSEADKAVIVVN